MSAEVVKKRGRPKKVVSESAAAENIEPVVKGTRQKSTTSPTARSATTLGKPADVSTTPSEDTKTTSTAVQKRVGRAKTSPAATNPAPLSPASSLPDASTEMTPVPLKPPTKTPLPHITPTSSKILNQVRALSSNAPSESKTSTTSPRPPKPNSITSPPPSENPTRPSPAIPSKNPTNTTPQKPDQVPPTSSSSSSSSKPAPAQPQAPARSRPAIPLTALNASIVSQLSTRSGARPGRGPSNAPPLPANYKPVARRVTMAIVALPVAIVTSWVLYNRLVLGEDRKQLVRPGMVMVGEESPSASASAGAVDGRDVNASEKNV